MTITLNTRLVHIDDTPSGAGEGSMDYKVLQQPTRDSITAICATERLLVVVSSENTSRTPRKSHVT